MKFHYIEHGHTLISIGAQPHLRGQESLFWAFSFFHFD